MTTEDIVKIYGIEPSEIKEWSSLSAEDKSDIARVLIEDGYVDASDVLDNSSYSPDEFHFAQGYIVFGEDDKEDIQDYLDANKKTYDVEFNDDASTNSKGWKESFDYCKDYIDANNGTNESYFADYKGGTVSIVCNETGEYVYEEDVK